MDRRAPSAALRSGRAWLLATAVALVVAACGGAANGGQPGSGDTGKVIAIAQTAFGSQMTSGTVEGNKIVITLSDASPAMAALFMCSNVKDAVQKDAAGYDVVMVDGKGQSLATLGQCKK